MEEKQVGDESCSAYWLSRHLMTLGDDDERPADDRLTKQNGERKLHDVDGECLERVIVVDCRPTEAYKTAHVMRAVSLSLPTLMTRRLARRQLAASTVIGVIQQQQQQRRRQALTTDNWKQRAVVFYDDSTSVPVSTDSSSTSNSCLVMMLAQRFNVDGHRAMILNGRFCRVACLPHFHFVASDHYFLAVCTCVSSDVKADGGKTGGLKRGLDWSRGRAP